MSGHTPGPWAAHSRPTAPIEYGHHVTTVGGLTVCNVTYQLPSLLDGEVVESTRIANARLIAAAPDLLEALVAAEAALNKIRVCCHHTAWDATGPAVIAARAAIAKATGGQP